jgi:hypothetical protein
MGNLLLQLHACFHSKHIADAQQQQQVQLD